MRRMGRALALLLTLAMLFTTFGFAEEVEAVDFAQEAIEASEQPADSAEEPVEEPIEEVEEESVEEPAEELVESPTEPVEEQPEELVSEDSFEMQNFGYIEKPCTDEWSEGEHNFVKGKCTECGYKCKHNRVETRYASYVGTFRDGNTYYYEVNDGDAEFTSIDAEKHLLTVSYRYVVAQCMDCNMVTKSTKLKKPVTYTVEAPHYFYNDDDEESDTCLLCGYKPDNDCEHENFVTVAHKVIDDYEQIDGVKHRVNGTIYKDAKKCLDCGAFFEDGDGEKFTEEEPHLKRELYQSDLYFAWSEAGENYENACGVYIDCVCGYSYSNYYDDDHTHNWVDCEEEWDERYKEIANDYDNHNRIVDIYTGKKCSVCGVHLKMKKTVEHSEKEPHVWDAGFCTICGMSRMCAHRKEVLEPGTYTAADMKALGFLSEAAPDIYTSVDGERHMISAKRYQIYSCAYCHELLRCELIDGSDVQSEEHIWNSKGKCIRCGYACKHEDKYTSFYGNTTVSPIKDKNGNINKKVHRVTPTKKDTMYQVCDTCGKVLVKKKTKSSYEEPHYFYDDGDEIICEYCDYVLDCDHSNVREIVIDDTDEGETVYNNTGDSNTHYVDGQCRVVKECLDCGEWEWSYDDAAVYYYEPAPHIFNDAGVCRYCGYTKEDAKAVALSIQKTKQLAVGETWVPTLNIAPKTATGVNYKSSNTKIFVVDTAAGKITAKKAGKAKLTVQCGNLKATCTVTVKKAATKIELPAEMTLGVGQRITLAATLSPKKNFANVSYESDDDSCVAVDPATGEIVAVSAGTANITATAINGTLTAKCAVTVTEAPQTISLSDVPKQMGKGETLYAGVELLDAEGEQAGGDVRYASSNTKVLKVGEYNGKVTATGTGTAKIYAFAYNGVQDSVEVQVTKAPKGITLSPNKTKVTLAPGEPYTFKAEITPGTASQLNYSSNKPQIATMERTENPGEFKITAVAVGTAKITISTFNKKKKTITVTVK